jgi:hypothetical protein
VPTTTVNALPYPAADDAPNGPSQIGALAQALDNKLVPRFTNATARNAAIPSPVNGQMAWTTGDKRLWVYDGSAWVYVGGAPPAMIPFPGLAGWNVVGVGSYSLPKIYKDGSGLVRGQGVVQRTGGGGTNMTMGTLPVGYRPLNAVETVTLGVTGAGTIATYQAEVLQDGRVITVGYVETNTVFFLNGLSFNPNN